MGYYDEVASAYSRDYNETGSRVGLGLIGFAGLSSAVSTFGLLVYISQYAFFSRDETAPLVHGLRSFSRSALGLFLYSLLISDLIQGAAFAIDFKWAADGGIHHSAACTAQGVVSQIGDLGGAIWSLAIAYYTFSLLFLVKKPPVWLTRVILGAGWTLIFVLPVLGPAAIQDVEKKGHFYGISGAWCWIGDGYQVERLIFIYMWIFLSLLCSLVFYGLVYLRFSGLVFYERGRLIWKKPENAMGLGCLVPWAMRDTTTISAHVSGDSGSSGTRPPNTVDYNKVGKHLKKVARRLMLYPLVYSVVTVPVAICRLGAIAGWNAPFGMYIFSGITFSSSGLTNVILFIATRHSFIQRVASIQPRIHVVTQQITVLEDSQGAQTIHLHDMSSGRVEDQDQDTISEKATVVDIDVKSNVVVQLKPGSMGERDTSSVLRTL